MPLQEVPEERQHDEARRAEPHRDPEQLGALEGIDVAGRVHDRQIAMETEATQVAYDTLLSRFLQELSMIGLLLGAAALGGGFISARNFVKRRLRFVDAAQKPTAPVLAGVVATAVAIPVAALPIISIPMAIAFGLGVGTGWASGQKAPPDP